MTRFHFLRHGQTASNAAGTIGGATDLPLTDIGLAQAEAAADLLRDAGLATIWASPLLRARQTAEVVARVTGLPITLLPDLQERNWGVWEGRPRSVLIRDATPEGGESPDAFRARIRRAMAAIRGPAPLIVAHSGTAREIHAMLSDAPFRRPVNGEVSVWEENTRGLWENRAVSPIGCKADVEAREPYL